MTLPPSGVSPNADLLTRADRQRLLERLAETATLPGHELGIVPFAIASPVAPASGFMQYDNDLAVIELLCGRLQISDPDTVARHT
jgi:hypothetical protein